jgi:hypothetical protein
MSDSGVSSRAARRERARVAEYTIDAFDMEFRLAIEGTPENALVMIADDYHVWGNLAAKTHLPDVAAMCQRREDALWDEMQRQHELALLAR